MGLADFADEVSDQSEMRGALDEGQHIAIAGASVASDFNWKLQVHLPFLNDVTTLRVPDVFFKRPLLIPARPTNLQEVQDVTCSPRIAIFGRPNSFRMDEGGGWKDEIRTDCCAGRRIKPRFQGAIAHSWILGCRTVLARGIHTRPAAGERFPNRRILTAAQYCSNTC